MKGEKGAGKKIRTEGGRKEGREGEKWRREGKGEGGDGRNKMKKEKGGERKLKQKEK